MPGSLEFRALYAPAATYRELAASDDRGAWTLLRRPLLVVLAMGVLLSLASSPRVSLRVVVDGMISFAFVPLAETIAAGAVYLRSGRRVPFTRVVDVFLVSNVPWLLWIVGFCAWQAMLVPTVMSARAAIAIVVSLAAPAAWAAYLDLHFFRAVLARSSPESWVDLVITRAIGWTGALGYFFGIAAWAQIVAWFR